MYYTRDDIVGYEIVNTRNLRPGDYVFWSIEGNWKLFTYWASKNDPHPDHPIGHEVVLDEQGNKCVVEMHSGNQIKIEAYDNFEKVIFETKVKNSLEKEIKTLQHFGYRNG